MLGAVERTGRADETAVIVCTDHGHYLGEKDVWGKPGVPVCEPLGHIPVIRQPFAPDDTLPFWALTRFTGNHLWQVDDDPGEERDLTGTPAEKVAADALADALRAIEAPDDQLVRLGLD